MNKLDLLLDLLPVLVSDGGMGTLLQQRATANGLSTPIYPETVTLESPSIVRSIHADYVAAGAMILLTNTFACSRFQLEKRGNASRFLEVHQTAAQVAREAAGDERLVFGDLGPLGEFFPPMGSLTRKGATHAYAERAAALAGSGCIDAILVETQYDLQEVECALDGVREATSLPLAVTMSFDTHGHTIMGVSPERFAKAMLARDIDLIGANCGSSIDDTLDAIRTIRATAANVMLWAKPNAGLPRVENGVDVYELSPKAFANIAKQFVKLGVRVFGGCCGTTPDHIAHVTEALNEYHKSMHGSS